ncbi:ankyrin-1-like [Copidosoma floridanum]|uniref:ankyrin-1-like n=1 Tax=Copidosoma floridanum TaxID=29053 RepID=UPI0006C9D4CE|nr:ankyrin-1-like [Copidosoma floridanum]
MYPCLVVHMSGKAVLSSVGDVGPVRFGQQSFMTKNFVDAIKMGVGFIRSDTKLYLRPYVLGKGSSLLNTTLDFGLGVTMKRNQPTIMQNRRQQNIHQAVCAGDIVQVYNSLTRYTSCANDYNFSFQTPLQIVYKNVTVCADHETVQDRNKLILIKLLIDHGAEVNMQGLLNKSPLFLAIQKNQVEGSKLLLRNNADPNVVNDLYDSALHASVKSQFEDITKHLLLYQTDLNIVNIFDYTPLDEAIYNSKFNMGQILIKHGAKSKNIYERLFNACDVVSTYPMLNEQPFIEFLLYHATEIDSHGQFTLEALMYYIVTTQHHERNEDQCFLRSYLDMMGINIDNGMSDSDLHIAIYDENKRDILTLLKSGSDVNVKNNFGNSPLHLLLETNDSCNKKWYYKIAKLLIEYGADLRSKNCLDETPFSKAVNESHDIKLIMMMLAKTAGVYGILSLDLPEEIDIPYLTTAYDENELKLHELITAIALSQEQLVDRLLEIDRLPLESKNYCCQDVNTALITAIDKGNYSIVKMLLESGFRTNRRFHTTCSSYRRHKNDLKIVCLLFEFKDSNIIHHMMKKAFFEVVENSDPNKINLSSDAF